MAGTSFPAKSAVASYQATERALADVLAVVPYCPAHEQVWSPSLVTVMLEAGSQLDSLWRAECRLSNYTVAEPNIKDYFTYFGSYVAPRWVVFWGEEPLKVSPFGAWSTPATFNRDVYLPLPWWTAYTKLKHDRLEHRRLASLENSVAAVAALFLAILRCEPCRDEIAQTRWLSGLGQDRDDPVAWLGEDSTSTHSLYITAETHLFTYPVGWMHRQIDAADTWLNPGVSRQFYRWFEGYSQPRS